ncbi:YbaK/EbsC family protein [Aerophototrophica crusticola]|uniref:YbaK/EbsC family protein n=1 Tax=Aerophototrophica crusticola TaxID=1709002 RepID=A0A858R894_9PROT|nr:YbaK/EbsC family protein [Rhodospirillaceae bacterium B3]
MPGPLSPSAQKIQDLLNDAGHPIHVVEFSALTRTAAEAASVIGCEVGQIAKSVIFRTRDGNQPVLVVASGSNRVNEAAVARHLAGVLGGDRLAKADADFVRSRTGYPIGGVPPLGHEVPPLAVLFDRDLLEHGTVWAAAGTPNTVFPIAPGSLRDLIGATVETVT